MSRFARHKDTAHRPTVVALRAAGASVEAMDLKDGPDLLVGYNGATLLMEVKTRAERTEKDGYTRAREGRLSDGQEAWHSAWKGGQVLTVYGPEEALERLAIEPQQISNLRALTNGWKKDIGTKPSRAPGKQRPFRPGTDKARSIAEMCEVEGCVTSQSPGMATCAAHAAEETFAPVTIQGVDYGLPPRVLLNLGDKTMDVTGYTNEEIAEAADRLINKGKTP